MAEIDPAILYSKETGDYLDCSHRLIVSGFRTALELLNIPLPEAAMRKQAGRPRSIQLIRACDADRPVEAEQERRRNREAAWEQSKSAHASRTA